MKSRLWEGEQRVKSAMTGIAVYKKEHYGKNTEACSNYKRGSKKSSENKKRIKSFKKSGTGDF